jgi:hypothetical protein
MADGPVIVVGGPGSWPAGYRGLAATLSALSGRKVHVVPLTPLDWVLGRFRGYGQMVFEVASTVDGALLGSEDDHAILVGHSAGGILARVFIGGDPPYGGRRYSGHRRISHLITLGTPHNNAVAARSNPTSRVNELFPGALHEHIRYVSVAGAAVDGATSPRARKRYERYVPDGRVAGDGLVPVPSALLPGAEALVLDDLYHGRLYAGLGGRWYGADRASVERWWPEELRVKGRVVRKPGA